jgi:hypothetical protein
MTTRHRYRSQRRKTQRQRSQRQKSQRQKSQRQKSQRQRSQRQRSQRRSRRKIRSSKTQRGGDIEDRINPNATFARNHPYDYSMCSAIMQPAKFPDFRF